LKEVVGEVKVKVIYEKGVLRPKEKLNLREKEEVQIEILSSNVKKTQGIIKINPDLAAGIAQSDELSALSGKSLYKNI
jgi:predicted DNA-binding antitoxin AbrB/MazE fold protein